MKQLACCIGVIGSSLLALMLVASSNPLFVVAILWAGVNLYFALNPQKLEVKVKNEKS